MECNEHRHQHRRIFPLQPVDLNPLDAADGAPVLGVNSRFVFDGFRQRLACFFSISFGEITSVLMIESFTCRRSGALLDIFDDDGIHGIFGGTRVAAARAAMRTNFRRLMGPYPILRRKTLMRISLTTRSRVTRNACQQQPTPIVIQSIINEGKEYE